VRTPRRAPTANATGRPVRSSGCSVASPSPADRQFIGFLRLAGSQKLRPKPFGHALGNAACHPIAALGPGTKERVAPADSSLDLPHPLLQGLSHPAGRPAHPCEARAKLSPELGAPVTNAWFGPRSSFVAPRMLSANNPISVPIFDAEHESANHVVDRRLVACADRSAPPSGASFPGRAMPQSRIPAASRVAIPLAPRTSSSRRMLNSSGILRGAEFVPVLLTGGSGHRGRASTASRSDASNANFGG
jgi:hypothetical protein